MCMCIGSLLNLMYSKPLSYMVSEQGWDRVVSCCNGKRAIQEMVKKNGDCSRFSLLLFRNYSVCIIFLKYCALWRIRYFLHMCSLCHYEFGFLIISLNISCVRILLKFRMSLNLKHVYFQIYNSWLLDFIDI